MLGDAHQIEPGIGDGSRPVGETDQRQYGSLRPNFGVIRAKGFHLRQR